MKKRSTTSRLNKVDYSIFIIFSIAAAAMLYLFYKDLNSYTIKQSETPVAKIYFKKNTAQRKFIDNDIWEVLTDSSDIYDGDRIRTSKNSEAYTEFIDSGIQIQLREKSMIQIFKNKKQRSVDFIGGEIFIANNSPEEKLVIHSGTKEIAVAKSSEVKIALPQVSQAAAAGAVEAEESPVVIEVVSGQVEVTEQVETKSKKEKVEPEPIVVSAGETVTLLPEVEKSEKALETVLEEKIEIAEETEATEENENLVEDVAEEIPEEEVAEKLEEKIAVEEPVQKVEKEVSVSKTVTPVEEKNPAAEIPAPVPPKPVEIGVVNTKSVYAAYFKKSVYDQENRKYNYSYGFYLSDATGKNMTINEGSVIELSFKGISDHDLSSFAMQISTGEEEWIRAHTFKNTSPNLGKGIIKDVPFEVTQRFNIERTIVNTDTSWAEISYNPEILDETIIIKNFEVSLKVISTDGAINVKKIPAGYSKTLKYDEITFPKDVWGQGRNDFDYRISIDSNYIFDNTYSIPAGTKVRISISGKCDQPIPWCYPEFIDTHDDVWRRALLEEGSDDVWGKLRFSENGVSKNQAFNLEREFTFMQDIPNTETSLFQFTPYHEGMKSNPKFTDFEITIEFLE